jgi:hypothetical protein
MGWEEVWNIYNDIIATWTHVHILNLVLKGPRSAQASDCIIAALLTLWGLGAGNETKLRNNYAIALRLAMS